MDPDLVHRLTVGEGKALLDSLPPYRADEAMTTTSRLRGAGFDADLVSAALTQSRLRARAVSKFGDAAAEMFFTPDGLEQATRAAVADSHATRFAQAGVGHLWDLGCGIGADSRAAAAVGITVHAVDSDATTAAVCRANLTRWPSAQVSWADAEAVTLPPPGARARVGVWFDPARRTPGVADITGRTRRLFRLEELAPSWEWITQVAPTFPAAGVKLSPGMPHARIPSGTEAQWTSVDGEVVECCLWWGDAVTQPGRCAAVLTSSGWVQVRRENDADDAPAPLLSDPDRMGRWLHEPDRAVLRAGLVDLLAREVEGAELDQGVGYVTTSRAVRLPWTRSYEVLDVLPLQEKALRAWSRGLGLGRVTLKKRGVSIEPERLRRSMRLRGEAEATLVLTRVAGRPVAVHVRPTTPAG